LQQLCAFIESTSQGARGKHHMQGFGFMILILGAAVANLPAVIEQWRGDRPGFIKTLWLMGAYALYVALGLWLLFLLMPRGGTTQGKALLLTGVMVGWIFYGAPTLMRVVPVTASRRAGSCISASPT
jgi:hypothetical protein